MNKPDRLEIVFENAAEASVKDKEAFCLMRREGIGGSESGTLLGVNKFKDIDTLIKEKCITGVTDEERAVGEKATVRKGADLEPIILHKFSEWSGFTVEKPEAMYRMKDYPSMTINFDGVIEIDEDVQIPVEAKLVSQWGQKYWKPAMDIKNPWEGREIKYAGENITEHVTGLADAYGIPPYYFTQTQWQLLALNANFGYLAALFDKDWELHVYKIFADKITQDALIEASEATWEIIQRRKESR